MLQSWQSIPGHLQQIIIGILASIVGGAILYILAFPVRRSVAASQERKKERDKKLKIHFEEINKEARSEVSEVSNVVEMYGAIVVRKGAVPLYHPDFVAIELPKFSKSFAGHFPRANNKWMELIGGILKHNESYSQLVQNIRNSFESEGIPVVDINNPPKVSPYIYDNIYAPLFSWWEDRHHGKAKPWPNFEHIETKPDFGPNHLLVAGWGSSAIAYAETDSDKERCKRAISRVAEDKDYENRAATSIKLANQRVQEIWTFKAELIDTLDDIDKFWPGTRNCRFKEEKNCSRCKELFH
jgi:hypothetical protein